MARGRSTTGGHRTPTHDTQDAAVKKATRAAHLEHRQLVIEPWPRTRKRSQWWSSAEASPAQSAPASGTSCAGEPPHLLDFALQEPQRRGQPQGHRQTFEREDQREDRPAQPPPTGRRPAPRRFCERDERRPPRGSPGASPSARGTPRAGARRPSSAQTYPPFGVESKTV